MSSRIRCEIDQDNNCMMIAVLWAGVVYSNAQSQAENKHYKVIIIKDTANNCTWDNKGPSQK